MVSRSLEPFLSENGRVFEVLAAIFHFGGLALNYSPNPNDSLKDIGPLHAQLPPHLQSVWPNATNFD